MFERKESTMESVPASRGGGINALLGEGVEFEGKLNFNGTVRIDGKFNGEIHSQGKLVIGEKAVVRANVDVASAEVGGQLIGNIVARARIDLRAKGRIEGDVQTPVLTVDEGGQLEGTCRMASGGAKVLKAVDERKS